MFTRVRTHLDGPPFVLPAFLDRVAERWWRARARSRVLLLLALAALLLIGLAARMVASPLGPPAVAWVATRDLAIGEQLGPGDLRRTNWPSQLLPDGALSDPAGTLAAPLPRGAVATDRHLGDIGPAAGMPEGRAVVPIPVDALPDLPLGVRIDVVTTDYDGTGRIVARDALVVQADTVAVWLAVDDIFAPSLAAAALHGAIGVVVVPP